MPTHSPAYPVSTERCTIPRSCCPRAVAILSSNSDTATALCLSKTRLNTRLDRIASRSKPSALESWGCFRAGRLGQVSTCLSATASTHNRWHATHQDCGSALHQRDRRPLSVIGLEPRTATATAQPLVQFVVQDVVTGVTLIHSNQNSVCNNDMCFGWHADHNACEPTLSFECYRVPITNASSQALPV